ncbi:MAG: 30S ribosomal protein S20 [Caldicoprobacter sp.]|uniref:30S ribosomal protein S20 n=1 Tax=Caldicoprobacter sp. TaxID=2004500 RepID=UPI00396DBDF4
MANTKSALKRIRIIKKRTLRNKMIRSSVKTMIKKFEKALEAGDIEGAKALFPQVVKKIDMAVSKGVIHRNTGNRKKSRLAIRLNRALAQQQVAQ